ncbi:MAG: hypothetical protein V4664_00245 [Patescibacteria group bacterium]
MLKHDRKKPEKMSLEERIAEIEELHNKELREGLDKCEIRRQKRLRFIKPETLRETIARGVTEQQVTYADVFFVDDPKQEGCHIPLSQVLLTKVPLEQRGHYARLLKLPKRTLVRNILRDRRR